MTAQIAIEGIPGSYEDLPAGTLVNLSNVNNTGVLGWHWTLLDIPAGSTAVLDDEYSSTPTFTADIAGTYLINLMTYSDAGRTILDDTDQKAAGVNLQPPLVMQWRIPAAGETIEFDTNRGWAKEVNAFLKELAKHLNVGNFEDVKTANYSPEAFETVKVDASGGTFTVTLPAISSANKGLRILVKDVDGSETGVTIDTTGVNTIDGQSSDTVGGSGEPYGCKWYESNGVSNWDIMATTGGGGGSVTNVFHRYTAKAVLFTFADLMTLSAVGATYSAGTITADANGAFPNIDGIVINQGDDILVGYDVSTTYDEPQAGYYTLTTKGDGSNPWVLTRKAPYTHGTTFNANNNGGLFYIEQGLIYGGKEFRLWGEHGDVIGTDLSVGIVPARWVFVDDTSDQVYITANIVTCVAPPNHTLLVNMPGSPEYEGVQVNIGNPYYHAGNWLGGVQFKIKFFWNRDLPPVDGEYVQAVIGTAKGGTDTIEEDNIYTSNTLEGWLVIEYDGIGNWMLVG